MLGRVAQKLHHVHSNRTGSAIFRTSRFVSSSTRIGTPQLRRQAPSSSTVQCGFLRQELGGCEPRDRGKNKPTSFGLDAFERNPDISEALESR